MPKEPKSKGLRISRFFQENIDEIRRRNTITEFERSPYFINHCKEETNLEVKKKKLKQKPFGPRFKGFSKVDQGFSEDKKYRIDQAVARSENRIREAQQFLGFSKEEISNSNRLCERSRESIKHFEKEHYFQGFSKEDQDKSISEISNILNACTSIRTDIYKNIDRRVLMNHISEKTKCEKVVCSKYWWQDTKLPQKMEDRTWRTGSGLIGENSLINGSKNGFKKEILKTDICSLDREQVILSEIQRLNEELREIRKIKYAASEETKLQNSPFIQIKKELIMRQFVPPESPHHLLEEQLYHDPWAMLVATIFLNKTSARAARPYVFWFLEENPDPLTVVEKGIEQLETYFGALGLQKTRATQVWRMSHDFIYKEWKKVGELYGVGQYGEDAFRMFCLGDFSVQPKDRYLKIYKAWYEMHEKKARLKEMNT